MFSVRQPLAMLLACHNHFFDSDRAAFTRISKAIAIISFRYNVICNLQSHDQECLYNDIAVKVSNGTYVTYQQVLTALQAVYPDDDQFKNAFTEKEFRTTEHYDIWDEAKIESRQKQLAKIAAGIWRID